MAIASHDFQSVFQKETCRKFVCMPTFTPQAQICIDVACIWVMICACCSMHRTLTMNVDETQEEAIHKYHPRIHVKWVWGTAQSPNWWLLALHIALPHAYP